MLSPRHLLVVGLYIAMWVVLAAIGDFKDDADVFLLPLWVGGSVLVGGIADKWWVPLVLGLVAATVTLVLGEAFNPCDPAKGESDCGNEVAWAYLLFFPVTVILVGLGVGAGQAIRHFWPSSRAAE